MYLEETQQQCPSGGGHGGVGVSLGGVPADPPVKNVGITK